MIDLVDFLYSLTCLSSNNEMPNAASSWLSMLGINTSARYLKLDITSNMRMSYRLGE